MGTPAGEGGQPPVPAPSPQTADPRVDEALARLDELAELPIADHPAVFEHVHQRLAEVLGDLGGGDLASGDTGTGSTGTGDSGSHGR